MHARHSRGPVHLLAVLLLVLLAGACAPAPDRPAATTGATPPPGPVITVIPGDGASAVNPRDPVSVTTTGGILETVTMTNN